MTTHPPLGTVAQAMSDAPADPAAVGHVREALRAHGPLRAALGLDRQDWDVAYLDRGVANAAYLVTAGDGRRLVLRACLHAATYASRAAQVEAEAEVLSFLAGRNVTGELRFIDVSGDIVPVPFLVMDFVPGTAMTYGETDITAAARLHARINATPGPRPRAKPAVADPVQDYVREAEAWIADYHAWEGRDAAVAAALVAGWERARQRRLPPLPHGLIHGDATYDNFRMSDGNAKLIDWDWSRYTHPAGDPGHFLSPITTRRRDGLILGPAQAEAYVAAYLAERPDLDPHAFREAVHVARGVIFLHSAAWTAAHVVKLTKAAQAAPSPTAPRSWERLHASIAAPFLTTMHKEGIW